jgi:hypothetical protein
MKKPTAITVVLLLLAPLPSISPALACGFMTRSLWSEVKSSDLIALARVARLERPSPGAAGGEAPPTAWPRVAVLELLDVWKGDPLGEVRVEGIESYDQRYEEGNLLVVFLVSGEGFVSRWRAVVDASEEPDETIEAEPADAYEQDGETEIEPPEPDVVEHAREEDLERIRQYEVENAGKWRDSGSNEVPASEGETRDAFARLIRRAAEIQRSDDGWIPPTEWVLAAAENPATRPAARDDLVSAKSRFTRSDLGRLAEAFVRAPAVDGSDITMLELLSAYPSAAVDRAAATVIEAGVRQRPIPDWVTPMVSAALRRYGDDLMERVGRDDRDPAGRLIEDEPDVGTIPTLWAVARRDLGIPQVPPANPPARDPR